MIKPRSKFKKVKWLFGKEIEIPEEWNIKKFKDMAKINPKKINKEYPNQNILYVNISSIDRFQIVDYDVFALADRPSRAQRIIERNDVIVSTVRPYLKAFSKVKKDKSNMICSTGFTVLRTKNKEDGELIFQFVQSKLFEMRMIREMEGLAYPAVTSKVVANSLIPYPIEKDEKQKIASILSGVDALIESTQKIIEKTERLKKGLMQKLLTKGIGHTKFKKTKWLFGKEIEIPQEWNVTRLIEQCIQKPKYGAGESAIEKDLKLPRYIRITDLNDDGSLRNKEWKSIKENAAKDYLLNYNDILFARTGATVGKSYLYTGEDGRCAFAGYLIKFQPDQTKLNSKFLFHYIHSIYYWKYIKSIQTWGVQPNINAEQYSNLLILLPPIHEQQKIASILSGVDAYIQKNQEYKKKMELLKKGLMQKLLTGQIRVKVNH